MKKCACLKSTCVKQRKLQTDTRARFKFAPECGVVLLQVMILTVILNLIAFTMVSLSLRSAQIEKLHHNERQAYWLARSTALSVQSKLLSGDKPESSLIVPSNTGTTTVTVSGQDVLLITVDAKTTQAESRIQFQFNQATKKVTDWMDSAGAGS